MSSPESLDDSLSKVRLDTPLNLSDLHSDKGFLMNTLDLEETSTCEPHITQNPEIYYKHDDLMKYVDLTIIDASTECDLSPFEKMKLSMTDITNGAGKVFKKVVKAGVGEVCRPDSVVKFHYVAFKEGEEVPYDISRLRRKFPETTQLGSNTLIQGLELGISSMRLNEEAHFLIHPDYAYGPLGISPRIPPNATLLFKVELLGIEQLKLPENEEFEIIEEDHSFEKLYKKAKAHLGRARHVKTAENNNSAAIKEYKAAINILIKTPLNNDEEEKMKRHAITKAYTNLMICFNDENLYRKVCIAYKEAMYEGCEEAEKNAKLIFQLAKAQCGLHDFDQATRLFLRVKTLDPAHGARVDKELTQLQKKKQKSKEEERLLYGKMFQS